MVITKLSTFNQLYSTNVGNEFILGKFYLKINMKRKRAEIFRSRKFKNFKILKIKKIYK